MKPVARPASETPEIGVKMYSKRRVKTEIGARDTPPHRISLVKATEGHDLVAWGGISGRVGQWINAQRHTVAEPMVLR